MSDTEVIRAEQIESLRDDMVTAGFYPDAAYDFARWAADNRAALLRALNDEQDARNADASRWLWRDRAEAETKRANDNAEKLRATRERVEAAERKVARVEALRDEHADEPHNGHAKWEGEPECPACWTEAMTAALNGDDA